MSAQLFPAVKGLQLVVDPPIDTNTGQVRDDLSGIKVWYSTTTENFNVETQGTLAYSGDGLNVFIPNLTPGIAYYVKYALISSLDETQFNDSETLTGTPLGGVVTVSLAASSQAIAYDENGLNPNPIQTNITATAKNTTGSVFYEFIVDNQSVQNTTTTTYSYTPPNTYTTIPTQITVRIREGSSSSTVLAEDTITIFGLKPGKDGIIGKDAITVILSNETHNFSASYLGVVDSYTGSGTTIKVFSGVTELTYDGVGVQANTWKVVASQEVNITKGSISSSGNTAIIGDHSNFPDSLTTASIVYSITGNVNGTIFNIDKTQTFSKSNAGEDGTDGNPGIDGKDAITVLLSNETHSFTATQAGQVNDYTGSGTIIRVFSGSTELSYDSTGTLDNGWKLANTSGNNIDIITNNIQYGTTTVTISDHTNFLTQANTANITYTITGKANGISFSTTKSQTFSKSKAGTNGEDGKDAINVLLSNETHSFTCDSNGQVSSYVGSGTDVKVFAGATELQYDGTGTAEGTWKVTVLSSLNITPSTSFTDNGYYVTIGDHNSFTSANTANITYLIQGTLNQTPFVITKAQTFSKSKAGATGEDGISSISVILSNETHSFAKNVYGEINYTGSGTEIRVFAGVTELQYEGYGASNISNNSWKLVIDQAINIISGNVIDNGSFAEVEDHYAMSSQFNTAYITYKITGKYNNNTFEISKTQTFNTLENGISAYNCKLLPQQNYFAYNTDGVSPTPTSTIVEATLVSGANAITGISELQNYYYIFALIDKNSNTSIVQQGSPDGNTQYNQYTYIPPANFNDFPQTLAVIVYLAVDLNNPIAIDTLALTAIKPGKDGIIGKNAVNVILSNDSHPFTAGDIGNVLSYVGSGTQIKVYSGVTELIYDGIGTQEGRWKVEINPASNAINITPGAISGAGSTSTTAIVADHSNFPDNQTTASITYTITGKADSIPFTINKTQKFSKSLKGEEGAGGQAALPSYAAYLIFQQKTIQYSATGTTPSPASQYIVAYLTENGIVVSDPELIYYFVQITPDGTQTLLQATDSNIISYNSPATFIENNQIQIAVQIFKVVQGQSVIYAVDYESLNSIMPGLSGISVELSNNTHVLPTDSSGEVTDYSGAATEIRVYSGTGLITYDGVGTANNTWKISSVEDENITVGTWSQGTNGNFAVIGAPSNFQTGAGLTATIKFNIEGVINNQSFTSTKTQTIIKSEPGRDSITALISKDTHSFTANTDNQVIDYANSGVIIKVLAGATELIYDGVGTTNGTWKVTASGTGITAGTASGSGPTATQAIIGNHSNFPDASTTAKVTYTISGTYNDIPFFITKEQTFSKSKTGSQGNPGLPGKALSVSTSSPFFLFPEWSTFYPITAEYSYDKGTGVEAVFNALLSYPQLQNAATIGKIYIFRYGTQADRYIRTLGKVNLADYTVITYKVMTGGANASTGASWGELPDAGDNLVLEYSTDLSNWTTITTHSPQTSLQNAWNTITTTLPVGAKTSSGVYLRFRQLVAESNADTWAVTPPEIIKYPSSITISAAGTNLTGSPSVPQILSGNITLTGSSYPYTLNYDSTSVLPVKLRVTWDGLSQDVEVGVTYESQNIVTGSLTKDSASLIVDAQGNIYPTNPVSVTLSSDNTNLCALYNSAGNRTGTLSTLFTATAVNTTQTPYYEFYRADGVTLQSSSTSNIYSWSHPTTTNNFPTAVVNGTTIKKATIIVRVRQGSATGPILAEDRISIIPGREFDTAPRPILTNEFDMVLPLDTSGTSDVSQLTSQVKIISQTGTVLNLTDIGIVSKTNIEASLNSTTGILTISRLDADEGTVVIQYSAQNQEYLNERVTYTAKKAKLGGTNQYDAAKGTFRVYLGSEDITGNGEVFYSHAVQQGNVTFVINSTTGEYSITNLTGSSAAVLVRAVYRGIVVEKLFTVTKVLSSLVVVPGVRGATAAYLSDQTVWSDSVATNYFVTTYGSVVIGDTLTMYSTGFSVTKFWAGSTWVDVTARIDGNLIVTGTIGAFQLAANSITTEKIQAGQVTAEKIDSRGLSIKDAAGNIILAAGTGLDLKYIDAISQFTNKAINSGFKRYETVATNTVLPIGWTIYNPNNYTAPPTSILENEGLYGTNVLRFFNTVSGLYGTARIGVQVSGSTYGPRYTSATAWHTISFYAKTGTSGAAGAKFSISETGFTQTTELANPALTASWQRYSWKVQVGATVLSNRNLILSLVAPAAGLGPGVAVDMCALQVQLGEEANAYMQSSDDSLGIANPITPTNIGTYIQSAAIDSAYIKDAAITNAKIGNLAVNTAKIQDGSISTAKIGDLQVQTLKIGTNAVSVPRGGISAAYSSGLIYGGNWAYRNILTFIPDINGSGTVTIGMSALSPFFITGNPSVVATRFAEPGEGNPASWNSTRISFIRSQGGTDTEIITTGNFQSSFWQEVFWYIVHDTATPGVPVTYKFGATSNQAFILQSPILSYFILESKK